MIDSRILFSATPQELSLKLIEAGLLIPLEGGFQSAPGVVYSYIGPQQGDSPVYGMVGLDSDIVADPAGIWARLAASIDYSAVPLRVIAGSPAETPLSWDAIKAERDRRMQRGGYRVGTNWFHSDTLSRTQQIGLIMFGQSMPDTLRWKTMSGLFVQMTPTLAQQIFAAAAASDVAIFNTSEQALVSMQAGKITALKEIVWPASFENA